MRVKEIKLYQFNELSDAAKEVAIDKNREINVDCQWWEFTYQDAKIIGLKISGFGLDRNRQATGELLLSVNEVAQNIFNEHGETCETYKTAANFMQEWQPIFNDYMDSCSENYESSEHENTLQELEDSFLNDLLEDYSVILQNEYEYLTSEESIAETLIANEYEFTQDGKMD